MHAGAGMGVASFSCLGGQCGGKDKGTGRGGKGKIGIYIYIYIYITQMSSVHTIEQEHLIILVSDNAYT